MGYTIVYCVKTLAPDNPGEAGGVLSLTRSLNNDYSMQNAQLKKLICYKLSVTEIPCIPVQLLIKPFNVYIKTLKYYHKQDAV